MDQRDWSEVKWEKTGGGSKSSRQQDLRAAARSGKVVAEKKMGAGTNAQSASGKNLVSIEEDTESFTQTKVSHVLRVQIMQERTKAGLTQKELATTCNAKISIIQDYEAGKAVPSAQFLKKIEAAIRQKNPSFVVGTFTKAHKAAVEKQKAAEADAKKKAKQKAAAAKTAPISSGARPTRRF